MKSGRLPPTHAPVTLSFQINSNSQTRWKQTGQTAQLWINRLSPRPGRQRSWNDPGLKQSSAIYSTRLCSNLNHFKRGGYGFPCHWKKAFALILIFFLFLSFKALWSRQYVLLCVRAQPIHLFRNCSLAYRLLILSVHGDGLIASPTTSTHVTL